MDCVQGFASSISKDLVCGAINQLRYPCCFNNFVKELAKEEGNLSATRKDVEDRIVHAKKQTRKTAKVVGKWLEGANIDRDNVNQLLEEARANNSCCFGYCPNWVWRYNLGKKLANKKRDLQKFIEEGNRYIQLERVASLPLGLLDFSSEQCFNFESRQSNYKQLMEALKDDGVAMIGLYGMGGCGKTTLAMEARKVAEAEHIFDKVLFVPVSSTVDVRKIQEKIASSLGYGFPEYEKEEKERAQRLLMRLTQEKNILVILDDVWQKIDLGAIGIPSVEHHKGCKVLITTRSKDVCTLMDCQQNIQLQTLKDEEAWVPFQKLAHITEDTSDVLKHLAREISDECKGLPVAIAAVASTLNGKAEVIWKGALKKLRTSKPINIEKGLINPYTCLKLSYDNLDTEESRSIFLLCSVFPEDSEIPIELLTRCVIGLGLVGEVHSYEEARWEVIEAKIKLVSSCLLLNADDECVKMHDLVRDIAQWIANNENKTIKCQLENDVIIMERKSLRYLYCENFPNDLDCSNLEFLLMQAELEVSDEIFKKMGNMRVLILLSNDKLPLSTMSFESLTNLRCLILASWNLNNISFVRYMRELQSLSLYDCSLHSLIELQSDVTQLTNWKFLEVRQCQMDIHNFEFLHKIPQLEELSIIDNSVDGDENIIEFFKTFSIPQTVDSYVIKIGLEDNDNDDDDDDDYFSSFSHKRTLMLGHFPISNEAIKGLAKKSKVLLMKNILGDANNVIPDIFQFKEGDMNELNELRIYYCEGITYLVDISNHLGKVGTLFSKLLVLRLYNMNHLRGLWHGYIPPSEPFKNLEKLCVNNCPRLTFLFTRGIARCLVQLKELKILECVELKHILVDDDTTEKSLDEFKVELYVQSAIFQNLQKVEVYECPVLKYVFPASIIGGLPRLKMMLIDNCDQLSQIIEDIVSPTPVMNFPFAHQDQKQEFIEIIEDEQCQHNVPQVEANQLENSSKNASIVSTPSVKNNSGSFILSSLTTLRLRSCPKLSSLFTKSTAETLTSLEELTIDDCHRLKQIVACERALNNKNIVRGDHDIQSHISIFKSLKSLIIRLSRPLVRDSDERQKESLDLEYLFCLQNYFEDNSYYPQQKNIQIGQVSLELKELELNNLSKMNYIWVASKNYFSLPNLEALTIRRCAKLEVIFPSSILKCLPNLKRLCIFQCNELKQIMEEDKELSSTQPCFPKLASLVVEGCHKLKSLFYVSSPTDFPNLEVLMINGATELEKLFRCKEGDFKNSFSLPSLKRLETSRCTKLEVIFPAFVLRCLPNLEQLTIKECEELMHIMEEVAKDKNLSNLLSAHPCFPKLASMVVKQCPKLKSFFSVSNDIPNLEILIISEAAELETLFGCEQGKGHEIEKAKVELPSLKLLIFMHLSNFCQGIELLTVKHRIVQDCPKLSLTSTTSLCELKENFDYSDIRMTVEATDVIQGDINDFIHTSRVRELPSSHSQINEKLEKELIGNVSGSNIPATVTSTNSELNGRSSPSPLDIRQRETHLQELVDGQSMCGSYLTDKQNPLEETESTIGIPQKTEDIRNEIIQQRPVSEGHRIKTTSTGALGIGLGGAAATHTESSGEDIIAQDSQVGFEQDKPNEGKTETMQCQEIQILEGLNMTNKQDGTNIVSNTSVKVSTDTRKRLESYKHFVDLDDAQIALLVDATTTYSHLWNACEKFSERFQAWMLKTLADLLLFLQSESVNSVTPQRKEEFNKLCDEAVEFGFDRSWVDEIRQSVVARDPELEVDQAQTRMDELFKRSTSAGMVPDSQVVEQSDRQIEYWRGTSPSQKIQNVDNSIQEVSHLIDKEGSDDRMVAPRNEKPEMEFVAKVLTSEIPATSSTNSELVERPSPSCLDIPQNKTHPNGPVDRQMMNEPCLMSQPKPLGEIVSTTEIPQSVNRIAEDGTISKNTNMAASSMLSESSSSESGQVVSSESKLYPLSETRSSQNETYTAKESGGHRKNIKDFGTNDMMSLFQPVAVEEDGEGQVTKHHSAKDNRVVKALADIEKCLKMPLKDIVSSETNTLCLMTALNFLSNLPFKDVTLSDGVRDIIDTMHKDFPSILRSFKQGFATSDKLAVIEAHQNEAAITLVSKISKAEKLMNEAEEKEGVLKERVDRLKKEIKECEAELSCLEEKKNKCSEKSKGYKKEVENMRKDKSQMAEDQSKVREQLSEVAYKWSALCSQFQHNRIAS